MKKLYTLTMFLLGFTAAFAQTFYQENFGTAPTGNPIATGYTQYQNTTVTYTGTGTLRNTAASTGYTGVSGNANVYFGAIAQYFLAEGINTSQYSSADLTLTFGQSQGTASDTPSTNFAVEVSSDGTAWTALPYTRVAATGWELITISGGIPSTTNLRVRFTQNTTIQYRIDDVKLSAVSSSCTFGFGLPTTACDAATLGTDTYTATIPFTGAANGVGYQITTTSGTIGGDAPATVAEGNITISGITENTNITVTVVGGTCNSSVDVTGVYCKPVNSLPYYEGFDYTAGASLGETQKWWGANSGDDVVVAEGNLTYAGLAASTGKSVTFSGAGKEAYTQFTTVTEGDVFSSFLINVTDLANITVDGTSSYVIGFLEENTNAFYAGRVFLKKVGEQYQIGIGTTSDAAAATFTNSSYDVNTTAFVVLNYDFAGNTLNAWVNPTIATTTPSTPATLTVTFEEAITDIGGFILRQDAATNTPSVTFDELRIGTTLASVVPAAAGVKDNNIANLKLYPNPVTGNIFNVTSNTNGVKSVAIFDVLGKQVLNTTTANGTVNVSDLNAGVYMVKITEEGKTATRKLVKQ